MIRRPDLAPSLDLAKLLAKWTALGGWVGLLSGVASWVFLVGLHTVMEARTHTPGLLFGLPLAGAAMAWAYAQFGAGSERGNNLILDRIHEPSEPVPFRMAPLILVATWATHLFGGSAGREGTAVQMGGTLGQLAVGPLRLSDLDRRILIMAGIAGGFGSVFGTPLAGTIFALEVLTIGRIGYEALLPCLTAAVVGDRVTRGLGIVHADYASMLGPIPDLGPLTLLLAVVAGVAFAGMAVGFTELTHGVEKALARLSPHGWVRALFGGTAVVGMTLLVGSQAYNGLSLGLIDASFTGQVILLAFAIKIVFTAVTLGSGFKGGEVTPLFCIGATGGHAFAQVTHQPTGVYAALGFAAVFAGAANTPIACVVMGIELFGGQLAVPLALACVTSYLLSGHRGIYPSQRIHRAKFAHRDELAGATLREVRERRKGPRD